MPRPTRPDTAASPSSPCLLLCVCLLLLAVLPTPAHCMTDDDVSALRDDTRHLFYHGYNAYMAHAFPEDELKPLSCQPQTRNRENPADIGLNDVLGNYSVTLIDSLSTLAILASDDNPKHAKHALEEFQEGVRRLVGLYGDGSLEEDGGGKKKITGRRKCGTRACAFDLDSKVQVFETNIRGVGGLLSAHLFAIGELPITGYHPNVQADGSIKWPKGFKYDGQLLRLAHDLASRLLPAFSTATGLPYPRVNLRHGIPFYQDAEAGVCRLDGTSSDPREITETCSAGAGSLVLEFSTLSRLTGDLRFEGLAKRAFWAVWERRSGIGLLGGGIDAESGEWTNPPLAGIGAGVDSFFEYALKSHVLLSGVPYPPHNDTAPPTTTSSDAATADQPSIHDTDAFLATWQAAHAAIKHHIYRSNFSEKHPYYAQSDLVSGAPRYSWIDNLSAYYPGLLTLAGEVEEAIETHLTYTALWTRYSALPERWTATGGGPGGGGWIDPNFRHWAGRPEFIESTYYLYQATRDPWFLSVGEMFLRDVRRRCWTPCGWAALGDVVSGEQRDRMESFFLGETAKYAYLLFSAGHPLNAGDRAVVFTTEGHPLVIPDGLRTAGPQGTATRATRPKAEEEKKKQEAAGPAPTCPAPRPPLPLTISHVANRADLFHAAALTNLHLVPVNPARSSPLLPPSADSPGISAADVRSPSNYTFYPWTLPRDLIPVKGTSSPIRSLVVSTLTFPNLTPGMGGEGSGFAAGKGLIQLGALQKVLDGVLINSLSNLRLNMVQEPKSSSLLLPHGGEGVMIAAGLPGGAASLPGAAGGTGRGAGAGGDVEFRIQGIANWALGRDEKVLVSREALVGVSPADPHFTRVKDLEMVDLVVDVPFAALLQGQVGGDEGDEEWLGDDGREEGDVDVDVDVVDIDAADGSGGLKGNGTMETLWAEVEAMVSAFLSSSSPSDDTAEQVALNLKADEQPASRLTRHLIPAILPTGAGAAPLPPLLDSSSNADPMQQPLGALPFTTIFYLDDTLCSHRLPAHIAKSHTILVLKRGGCSFGEKLANIPAFPPSHEALQLVIVVSVPEAKSEAEKTKPEGELIRPLLESAQKTAFGLERRHPIAMVMVDGSAPIIAALKGAASGVGAFDERGKLGTAEQRRAAAGTTEGQGEGKPGVGVKRRYWFESMGVPIGNLIML